MKLNICQELNCKKLESKDHVGTLCKKHAEIVEHREHYYGFDPLKYKTTNEKNNVWENGVENVRSIPTSFLNDRIKKDKKQREEYESMIKLINEQIEIINNRIKDNERTKNMRYVK
jgi:hypothetical protein